MPSCRFQRRSYICDNESGLYYVSSRYYDPAICRFINADDPSLLGANGDFASLNLFAYCGNNPISRADSGGQFWHIVAGAALGAVAGVVTKMITNAISGQEMTNGLLTAGISGAMSGGLAASGVGLVGQVVGNAFIGAGNNAADQLVGMANGTKTDGFDVGSMLLDGTIGAVAGFAGGPGAGNRGLTNIGLKNVKRAWNALTHKGAKVALEVLGQGLTYFGKNARHIVKPLVTAIAKSSGSVIINNTAKVMIA